MDWKKYYEYISDDDLTRNFLFSQHLNPVLNVAFCIYNMNSQCYIENSEYNNSYYENIYHSQETDIVPFLQFILEKKTDICDFPKIIHSRIITNSTYMQNNIQVITSDEIVQSNEEDKSKTESEIQDGNIEMQDGNEYDKTTEQNAFETECFLEFIKILENYFKIKNIDKLIRLSKIEIKILYKGFIENNDNNITVVFDSTLLIDIIIDSIKNNKLKELDSDISSHNIISEIDEIQKGGRIFEDISSVFSSSSDNTIQEENSTEYYLAIIDEIVFIKRIHSFLVSNYVKEFFIKNENFRYIRYSSDNSSVAFPLLMYLLENINSNLKLGETISDNEEKSLAQINPIGIISIVSQSNSSESESPQEQKEKKGEPLAETEETKQENILELKLPQEQKEKKGEPLAETEETKQENILELKLPEEQKEGEEEPLAETEEQKENEETKQENISESEPPQEQKENEEIKQENISESEPPQEQKEHEEIKQENISESEPPQEQKENEETKQESILESELLEEQKQEVITEIIPKVSEKSELNLKTEVIPNEYHNSSLFDRQTINIEKNKEKEAPLKISGGNNNVNMDNLTPLLANNKSDRLIPYNHPEHGYMYYFTQEYVKSTIEYKRFYCFTYKCLYDNVIKNDFDSSSEDNNKLNLALNASTIYFQERDKPYWGIKNILQFVSE